MAIYTKKGDKGKTKVFDKKTGLLIVVSKKSCQIRAIGAIDELNSYLGFVVATTEDKGLQRKIREVQGNLFVINSILAGSKLRFSKTKVKKLEKQIDEWEGSLPVQKNFIYYVGPIVSVHLFYARALCRRAERSLVLYYHKLPTTDYRLLTYVNRLSDYLFMTARKTNFDKEAKEEYWIIKKK